MSEIMLPHTVISATRRWVETVVVELNLCPFARRELQRDSVRFSVTAAVTTERLLMDLQTELVLLSKDEEIETSLLIHPKFLQDFDDYNQFLHDSDELLLDMDLDGIFQIASFHPDYQFAGTEQDAVENFSNKSPYPMLHLIRESSVERAIASNPGSDQIPQRNIELLQGLGLVKMRALLQYCLVNEEC